MATQWLIDSFSPPSGNDLDEIDRELVGGRSRSGGKRQAPRIAVSLHDVTIHDTRKWFGEADIRLDALVVTGYGDPKDLGSFYMPGTQRFPRIRDGDKLPLGPTGFLMFHGCVSHFLDISIIVSRDRRDSENLAQLVAGTLASPQTGGALGSLLGLVAAPQAEVVVEAVRAAASLGDLSFRLLYAATGAAVGLYRGCHLQYRDGFGIGSHPGPGQALFHVQDLSFRYEIVQERKTGDAPGSQR